jgi:hypothetical protein
LNGMLNTHVKYRMLVEGGWPRSVSTESFRTLTPSFEANHSFNL